MSTSSGNRIYILGAGASTEYESRHPLFGEEIKSGLPVGTQLLHSAIQKHLLREATHDPLLQYIRESPQFGQSFSEIQNGDDLDVEQLYKSIDEEVERQRDPPVYEQTKLVIIRARLRELLEDTLMRDIYTGGICRNHSKLAARALKEHATIISFNWDTLVDDALNATDRWYYETGYGLSFAWKYENREAVDLRHNESKITLLKPHGSLNWFRYGDTYLGRHNGFTCERPTDGEKQSAGLYRMPTEKRTGVSHPVQMTLKQGIGLQPPLKQPVEALIVPPGEVQRDLHPQIHQVNSLVAETIRTASHITVVGFAFKETDADSRTRFLLARQESPFETVSVGIVDRGAESEHWRREMTETCKSWFGKCDVEFRERSFGKYCDTLRD